MTAPIRALLLFLSAATLLAMARPGGASRAPLLASPPPASDTSARVQAAFGQMALAFEPNAGQSDPTVQFLARVPGATLFLTTTEAVLALRPPLAPEGRNPAAPAPELDAGAGPAVVRLQFEGANPAPALEGEARQSGLVSYFRGNDPSRWQAGLPTYGQVRYTALYPGVDLVWHGGAGALEYDFVVAPGADPAAIRLRLAGGEPATLTPEGDLLVRVTDGELRQRAPALYQDVDGRRVAVAGGYALDASGLVGIAVEGYDRTRPLVIDPVLGYSHYLGGSADDQGSAIAVDGAGSAYVTGSTTSIDFSTAGGGPAKFGGGAPGANRDAFVAKLNPTGTALAYSVYLGGSSDDVGHGIAVDGTGSAYVTGQTTSTDFPTAGGGPAKLGNGTPGQNTDAFVARLNPAGTALTYSVYVGGTSADVGSAIAVDGTGNAYVTGFTLSTDFPTAGGGPAKFGGGPQGGISDAFVAKLNPAGSALPYSAYLGGSSLDQGNAIAVDGTGSAYVTGITLSTDFPTAGGGPAKLGAGPPAQAGDTFVTKLNPAGTALAYSVYLGGTDVEQGNGITVDGSGSAYLTGITRSADFPTAGGGPAKIGGSTPGQGGDGFVAKLSAAGSALAYSVYLGGSSMDVGNAIAVDGAGSAYVTGLTVSLDFPTADGGPPKLGGGIPGASQDAFVLKLNPAGSALAYGVYLGGSAADQGNGIAVDGAGNAYVTGSTASTDFPTAGGGPAKLGSGAPGESQDAFVAQLAPIPTASPTATPTLTLTPTITSTVTPTLTSTPTSTATTTPPPTPTSTPTVSSTRTSTVAPSSTPGLLLTASPTPTATGILVGSATPTVSPTLTTSPTPGMPPIPPVSGTPGVGCATVIGQTCTAVGAVSGIWTKTGSGVFTFMATGPAGAAVGGVPTIFIPTTVNPSGEQLTCSPTSAALTTTCNGATRGDPLCGGIVTVAYPLAAGGFGTVTSGPITGPNCQGGGTGTLVVCKQLQLIDGAGGLGINGSLGFNGLGINPVAGIGGLSDPGTGLGLQGLTVTFTTPPGGPTIPNITLPAGQLGPVCAAGLAVNAGTVAVTEVVPLGFTLQSVTGGTLSGNTATATIAVRQTTTLTFVNAPATVVIPSNLPLLPPPLPLLPPSPLPLLLPPPLAPAVSAAPPASPGYPEVPVIPEANSLLLLVSSLAGVVLLAGPWRRRPRRP